MKIKLEVSALFLGILGCVLSFIVISMWHEIPFELRELFRGGNIGALILGSLVISGFVGFLIFIINLTKSQFKLWWLRGTGFVCFILLTITISTYV